MVKSDESPPVICDLQCFFFFFYFLKLFGTRPYKVYMTVGGISYLSVWTPWFPFEDLPSILLYLTKLFLFFRLKALYFSLIVANFFLGVLILLYLLLWVFMFWFVTYISSDKLYRIRVNFWLSGLFDRGDITSMGF